MKIRKDFVTNSSSSSFIIAFGNDDIHRVIAEAIAESYDSFDTCTGKIITSEEALNEACEAYDVSDTFKRSALQMLKQGKLLVFKNIGYDAQGLVSFIEALAERDDSVVLLDSEYC